MPIESEQDFSRWVRSLPPQMRKRVSSALALRVATRIFPLLLNEMRLADGKEERLLSADNHILAALSYLARGYASREVNYPLEPYSHYRFPSGYGTDSANSTFRVLWAAQAAAQAASYTDRAYVASVRAAGTALERAMSAGRALKRGVGAVILDSTSTDIIWLEENGINSGELLRQKLWLNLEDGEVFLKFWNELQVILAEIGSEWQVWIDWYNSKINGNLPFSLDLNQYFRMSSDFIEINEAIWTSGSHQLNSEFIGVVKSHGGVISDPGKIFSSDVVASPIPSQGAGPQFELDSELIIDRLRVDELDQSGVHTSRVNRLKPLVLRSLYDLESRISRNEFPELAGAVAAYREALSFDSDVISWGEIWGLGVIISNSAAAAARSIDGRILPQLEDPTKAALDSFLALHGPMILATQEGLELTQQSDSFRSTKTEREALRAAAENIAGALSKQGDVATQSAINAISTATDAMSEGPHPERGAVYGVASIRNIMAPLIAAAMVTSPAAIGYILAGAGGVFAAAPFSLIAVESLKKSENFISIISALGSRFDAVLDGDIPNWIHSNSKRMLPFKNFVVNNESSLREIAYNTSELRWMIRYIDFITQADKESGKKES